VLLAAMLAVGTVLLVTAGPEPQAGATAVIKTLKGETLILDLRHSQTVEVEGLLGVSIISVEDGKVRFVESPCPHKLCVRRGPIFRVGDLAACLPNGVLARIEGACGYDGITP
jgi:hypothetical protein